jgi:hypothetical protein
MTAIRGYIQPSRRPGELGIHSVDHFNFAVPDLAVAQNFYGEFGLDVGERGNRLTLGTFAQPHIWGTIGEGPRKKLGYISFGAFEDDIERFSQRLQDMAIKRLDPPPGIDSNGVWFRDTTAFWLRSKLRRNHRPTRKPASVIRRLRPVNAERPSAAPCRGPGRGGCRMS